MAKPSAVVWFLYSYTETDDIGRRKHARTLTVPLVDLSLVCLCVFIINFRLCVTSEQHLKSIMSIALVAYNSNVCIRECV